MERNGRAVPSGGQSRRALLGCGRAPAGERLSEVQTSSSESSSHRHVGGGSDKVTRLCVSSFSHRGRAGPSWVCVMRSQAGWWRACMRVCVPAPGMIGWQLVHAKCVLGLHAAPYPFPRWTLTDGNHHQPVACAEAGVEFVFAGGMAGTLREDACTTRPCTLRQWPDRLTHNPPTHPPTRPPTRPLTRSVELRLQ